LEFLTAVFCSPCSTCQMARHTYGYTSVLDGDSDFNRPDKYTNAV